MAYRPVCNGYILCRFSEQSKIGYSNRYGGYDAYFSFSSLVPFEELEYMRTRIKELRARENLTQIDLAKKVGVRRETIVFLEKGKYNPSLKLAYDISQVFKMRIEEVFIFE